MEPKSAWILLHYEIAADVDETEIDETILSERVAGFYSSEEQGQAAIQRLRLKPGFRDWPDGFRLFPIELDRAWWNEGFVNTDEGGVT
ncbi:hypothetical protein G3576_21645 [Roseomonas stagni]|uniref:Uncharacterized protein n=1 Tax=Falsiroseomonas algicola TaxID=2716930 RepID=A0A6M1LRI1_9PROT|nr:hypothetical protein [Falsiroseomonas algicola]NGM22632.1 hypothetical protein [Falsiroseomonas algicola]